MKNYAIIQSNCYSITPIVSVLKEYNHEVKCIGILESLEEATETILEQQVDFIFLDLESIIIDVEKFLLDISNFSRTKPYIIGCSSRRDEAYTAFQYNLADFLLIDNGKLNIRKCLHKYLNVIRDELDKMICIKSNKDYQYLSMNEILFLKADNNTTDIYMSNGSKISAFKTLKTFEDGLPKSFYRIHKSYIINSIHLDRIHYGKKICELFGNSIKVPFSLTFLNNINNIKHHFQYQSHIF